MRAPQTGRWMRRKAQTEGCIAALRREYPANPVRALPASVEGDACIVPQRPNDTARPQRRAKTPTLHCGREREMTRKRQPPARPVGGPMRSSAPTQALRADGGMRRPAAPRFCHLFTLHCRAGVHARRGLCPTGIPQTPAGPCPASVGGDACIVPQRPNDTARPQRRARTPTLQYGRKPCGPMQASAPAEGMPYGRDSLRDSRQPSAMRSPALERKAGDRRRSGPVFRTMSRPAQLQLFCNLVHNAGTGRYFYALLAPPPRLTYSLKMLQYNLYDSANLPPLSAAAGRKNQGRTPQC